jgi:integrase
MKSNLHNSSREDNVQYYQLVGISALKYYAEYYEFVSDMYSAKYAQSVKTTFNHVLKYFGETKKLSEIGLKDWELFFNCIRKKSPGAVPVYYRNLKAAMNRAVGWKHLDENLLRKIKLPKYQRQSQLTIGVDELKLILLEINNPYVKMITKTGFYTGCRVSELVNLKVRNVDLEQETIQIGDEDFTTKSRKTRIVLISQQLKDLLETCVSTKSGDDYLFGKTRKQPFTSDYVSKQFKKAVLGAGLSERIHFHTLRHSYGSLLANENCAITVVKDLMGHSDISTTLKYLHSNISDLRKSLTILNNIN